jgi:hypothetical protein
MTDQIINDLFDEMDRLADLLRSDPLHVPEDNQIAFRQLQKKRLPDLTKQQFLNLFDLWQQHSINQVRAELAQERAHPAAGSRTA